MRRDKEAINRPCTAEDLVQFRKYGIGPTVPIVAITENGSPAWLVETKNLPVLALCIDRDTRNAEQVRESFRLSAYHPPRESPHHAHRAVADEYGVLDQGPADASRQQAAI
jgi:hypothetical protein